MKKKAFTIIELLVVIGIISILTGVVMINHRPGQRDLALQRAASQLAQDIRGAQEMATSAKESTLCAGKPVPPGYGVNFNTSLNQSYIIFADCDDNKLFGGIGETVLTITIEKDVTIDALSVNPLTIVFTSPDPTVTITLPVPASIQLKNTNDKIKTITVNAVGSIEID